MTVDQKLVSNVINTFQRPVRIGIHLAVFSMVAVMMTTERASAALGAISSALGNSGRAAIELGDAPILNPALVGFLKGYLFSSSYTSFGDRSGRTGAEYYLSLTESLKDTIVPTTMMYQQSIIRGGPSNQELSSRQLRLAFGNIVNSKWAFGMGLNYKEDRTNFMSGNRPDDFPEKSQQINLTFGNVFPLTRQMGAALVIENVIPTQSNIPETAKLRPKTAFGFNYTLSKVFQIRADSETGSNNSFDRPIFGMGIQSFPNKWWAVRFGTQRDVEQQANIYSTGLGFSGPKFGIHYAYQNSPQIESMNRHSVDLAIPLW